MGTDASSTTDSRRMLKGKRKGNKKMRKARKAKKNARKQNKLKSFNGKQKKQAQRRANKQWRSEKMSRQSRKERRSLDDTTTSTTTSDSASYADYCYNDDGTACTFNELTDSTWLCDTDTNSYAQAMCDSAGIPYRGEICALADSIDGIEQYAMIDILCDVTNDDGTTTSSLASNLCNAWQDACVNSIPAINTICTAANDTIPWDSLSQIEDGNFSVDDVCYHMSSAYEPQYPEIVDSSICDIDSTTSSYV
jgi:hypothetical protein